MIVLPATLDRESRGEFFRYCGETFMLHIKAGVPAKEARRYAIHDTNNLAAKYIENVK
jgi:hypothetical protein